MLPLGRVIVLLVVGGALRLVFAHLQVLDDARVALSHRSLAAEPVAAHPLPAEPVAVNPLSAQPLLYLPLHQSLLSDPIFDPLGCSEVRSLL